MVVSILRRKLLLLFFLLTFFTQFTLIAQDVVRINSNSGLPNSGDFIFRKNHISILVQPLWIQKAFITRESGNYILGASSQPGLELGLKFHRNFRQKYSFNIGVLGGMNGRNFLLYIPKEDFTPPASSDEVYNGALSRSLDLFYLSLPVEIERRFFYNNRKFITVAAGLNLRYGPQSYEISEGYIYDINGNLVRDLWMELSLNNKGKPWINYNLAAGHSWVLKNNNILKSALMFNLSYTKYVNGRYEITVPGKPVTTGRYGVDGTGFGISFSYVFTGGNNYLRKKHLDGRDQ